MKFKASPWIFRDSELNKYKYNGIKNSGGGIFEGSSAGYAERLILLRIPPGLRLFTRMLDVFSSSSESTCIRPSAANFETAYAAQLPRAFQPTDDDVIKTLASGELRRQGNKYLVSRKTAEELTLKICSHVSVG